MKLNNLGIKTRILQYIFFTSTLISPFILNYQWGMLSIFMYMLFVTLGGNIGLHRYYGHNSFKTNKFWHEVLTFFSHYIGVGSVISWVGQHRYHHLYADTKKDIHSPHTNNILKVIFGLWKVNIRKIMIEDVIKNKSLKIYHKYYFKLHSLIIIIWLIIDYNFNTYLFLSIYAIPNFLCLISGYILSFVTHTHGYQTFDTGDKSTNSWIANILTLGEGWHNNHHKFPNNWNTKIKKHEWDFPALIINHIKK